MANPAAPGRSFPLWSLLLVGLLCLWVGAEMGFGLARRQMVKADQFVLTSVMTPAIILANLDLTSPSLAEEVRRQQVDLMLISEKVIPADSELAVRFDNARFSESFIPTYTAARAKVLGADWTKDKLADVLKQREAAGKEQWRKLIEAVNEAPAKPASPDKR